MPPPYQAAAFGTGEICFHWTSAERAFEWLEKAIDARDPAVTHMPSMPIYDGIRGDPRFRALLAKMGLA